jgi:ribose 5-phosphate isomerase
MSFDIVMKKDEDQNKFASEIAALTGISEVGLVAARHDVDY